MAGAAAGPLRDPPPARPRRHGHGLRRLRSTARARGRDQGVERGGAVERSRGPAAPGGARPRAPRAPGHRAGPRRGRARRRPLVLRDEVRARRDAAAARRVALRRGRACSASSSASPRPSPSRTRPASCIAISSRRTSWSAPSAKCWCSTGASPRCSPPRRLRSLLLIRRQLRSAPSETPDRRGRRRARGSGRRASWRRNRSAGTRRRRDPRRTSTRSARCSTGC